MNMPMEVGPTVHGIEKRMSAVVGCYGATDTTPDFNAVPARRDACDVNGCAALAPHLVVHGRWETEGLHQVNASIPCDDGLKHHKTPGGGETFHLSNMELAGCTAGLFDQLLELLRPCIHGVSFDDGPSPEEAECGSVKQSKEVGEVFKTVVWEVYQHRICLRAKVCFCLPLPGILAHDGFW